MRSLSSPEATRRSRRHELEALHGVQGEVYAVTTVTQPPAGFEKFAPYNLVLVTFPDGSRRTFMGMYGEQFEIGDTVECAPGNFPSSDKGIIPYAIKVRHPITSEKQSQTRFDQPVA